MATTKYPRQRRPERISFGSRAPVPHYVPGHKLVHGTEETERGTIRPTSWLERIERGEGATVFPCKRLAERAVFRTLMRTTLGAEDLPVRQVA